MRRWTCSLALLAAAWLALPSMASARTKTVYAGGPPKWAGSLINSTGAGVNNFLVNKVTIHVGDTVDWNGASLSSGFHTIDIPKVRKGSVLPLLVPGATVTGQTDAAGNPFWFNGKVPSVGFNPGLLKPTGGHTYNGKSGVDSGLPLGKPTDFKVKFTKAGVYRYYCDVHYGMRGTVVVKPRKAKIPSAKQDAKTLSQEEKHFAKEAKQLDKTTVPPNTVQLGATAPDGVEVFAMFPRLLHIAAGTTVQFAMSAHSREVHTATFGPGAASSAPNTYVGNLSNSFIGQPSPIAVYPSDPPGTITLSPTSHGNGFANTGVMDDNKATPSIPAFGAIKFTTPGQYAFECLIHTFMTGSIVVTPY